MTVRDKTRHAITRYGLLHAGDRVLIGVSGGQDSLTLLFELHALAPDLSTELVVGHLHHGLRGEAADADQQYVGELAAQLDLPFVTDGTDVAALAATEKIGLEEAGRRARYRFFDKAADAHQCNRIALAHTATDRAETLLMNLFRGAGLHGLRSIPPRRDHIVRPLILVSRQETAEYCRTSGLGVCTDSTNLDPTPLRNRVRAELLPHLEREYGPGIEAALCRAAEHALAEIEWTEPLVREAYEQARTPGGLSAAAVRDMPSGLRQRVLRQFLSDTGHPLTDLSQERWEALEALITEGRTGRNLELAANVTVGVEYDLLRRVPPGEAEGGWDGVFELPVPGRVTLPDGAVVEACVDVMRPRKYPAADAPAAVLDADKAGSVLWVRQARPGDRFMPLGMTGQKKLQDFFVDEKVPPRQRMPVVVTREDGEIVWVAGHRVAETAKVDEGTQRIVVLGLTRPDGVV